MYLFQRNIALGPKFDLCRHSSAFAPCSIARPVLRQIQLIPYRQTAVVIGDREADSDLAVVRLTHRCSRRSNHSARWLGTCPSSVTLRGTRGAWVARALRKNA